MAVLLEINSTLTDRYQTTVPETVRRALKLSKRDKIHYSILPDGAVLLTRAVHAEVEDPVMEKFLAFLSRDIANHPERLQVIDTGLAHRIQSLVGGMDVDIEAPLLADDE